MKKIIYGIMICIIIVGIILISTIGLNKDLIYKKNVRIDVYIGKTFNNKDIKQIAKEVFETDNVIIQQVEYYEDMASILVDEEVTENIDEKLETLNTKINEKYELENKVSENIQVTHQPKVRLHTIIKPYITPILISLITILIYAVIRYKKLGMLKIALLYILSLMFVEALYVSILAITRFPVNRLVVPVGLLIYIITLTVVTIINENKYSDYIEKENKQ